MTIYFNDEAVAVTPGKTLSELLMALDLPSQPYALAVNLVFVPKLEYARTFLAEGDRIDLVVAAQGG